MNKVVTSLGVVGSQLDLQKGSFVGFHGATPNSYGSHGRICVFCSAPEIAVDAAAVSIDGQ